MCVREQQQQQEYVTMKPVVQQHATYHFQIEERRRHRGTYLISMHLHENYCIRLLQLSHTCCCCSFTHERHKVAMMIFSRVSFPSVVVVTAGCWLLLLSQLLRETFFIISIKTMGVEDEENHYCRNYIVSFSFFS
jgi:hypothetical protein